MEHWEIILIFISLLIIGINLVMFVMYYQNEIELPNTPKDIYDNFNVNWFGAITLYLLIIILLPIIYLGKFIYFIFTAGRKGC